MNLTKLLKHNMARPIDARLSVADIREREGIARERGNMAALIADIDASPAMTFKRRWDAFINSGYSTFQDFLHLVESEVSMPVAVRPALPSGIPMPPNKCLAPRINL